MRFPFIFLLILPALLLTVPEKSCAVNYGEAFTVDTTWWYNQHTSTVGKMIARDSDLGTHFIWTDGFDEFSDDRQVIYSFCDDDDGEIGDQVIDNHALISQLDRTGYGNIDLIQNEEVTIAACFYYGSTKANLAVDFERGAGAFSELSFGRGGMVLGLGPKGTINQNRRAHVTASNSNMGGGGHVEFEVTLWNADPDEFFFEWDVSDAIEVETCTGITQRIQASRSSEKVAMIWHKNLLGLPPPRGWENTIEFGMNNDLYLIESPDGEEWDFENVINITRSIEVDPEREDPYHYGDTLRAYNDVDLIYFDDVLHVVFTARGFKLDPTNENIPPVESITTRESFIWHWDSESDSLTLVADGWYENDGEMNSLESNVDRPSIAVDDSGNLYCVYRKFTEEDRNDAEKCMGEIYLSISTNGGISWSEGINLTGTENGNPDGLEYSDENFPSVAEYVDEYIHFQYQISPDNYGLIDEPAKHLITYHRIEVDELPDLEELQMPRENFQFHNQPYQSTNEINEGIYPGSFEIVDVYPNPFNSSTVVRFTMNESSKVKLFLTDLKGRTILNEVFNTHAGINTKSLDVSHSSSGIYVLHISDGLETKSAKLVLIR